MITVPGINSLLWSKLQIQSREHLVTPVNSLATIAPVGTFAWHVTLVPCWVQCWIRQWYFFSASSLCSPLARWKLASRGWVFCSTQGWFLYILYPKSVVALEIVVLFCFVFNLVIMNNPNNFLLRSLLWLEETGKYEHSKMWLYNFLSSKRNFLKVLIYYFGFIALIGKQVDWIS